MYGVSFGLFFVLQMHNLIDTYSTNSSQKRRKHILIMYKYMVITNENPNQTSFQL